MRETIESAEKHAAEARERAFECADPRMIEQWLTVARMWEQLAEECRAVEKAREEAGS